MIPLLPWTKLSFEGTTYTQKRHHEKQDNTYALNNIPTWTWTIKTISIRHIHLILKSYCKNIPHTKLNSEKWWLEDDPFLLGQGNFSGTMLSFRGVYFSLLFQPKKFRCVFFLVWNFLVQDKGLGAETAALEFKDFRHFWLDKKQWGFILEDHPSFKVGPY